MSSSARLYERLAQIPDDPEDPESLEDVIVCAFGAFERYYVCWKTRGGAYRQDGYDLPLNLKEFLFEKADERDFASLQVVFGRGSEFFASDSNGKLEYKEPEPEKKEPTPEELVEKRVLRRSRTISFMRPRSDESNRQNFPDLESQSPAISGIKRIARKSGLRFLDKPTAVVAAFKYPDYNPIQAILILRKQKRRCDKRVGRRRHPNRSSADPSVCSIYEKTTTLEYVLQRWTYSTNTGGKASSTTISITTTSLTTRTICTYVPNFDTCKAVVSGKAVDVKIRDDILIITPTEQPLATRSISPPFQLPDQTESPMATEEPHPLLSLQEAKAAARMSPISDRSAPLSLHITKSSVTTTPISQVAAPVIENSPPPALSIQIISTTVQTSPISPTSTPVVSTAAYTLPPALSMHFSAISTTPIEPSPPPALGADTAAIPVSISTSSTSTQTSPLPSPLRTALGPLRIDTGVAAPSFPQHSYSFSTSSSALDIETPQDYPRGEEYYEQGYYEPPPVTMGRMMDYYSKPGYQLGASLFGGYYAMEPMIEDEGEGELTEWERANGRGY
ncbi:uncharacterized protein N0V89_000194 [Didymosphaeria variabile]|uniref:Uncharacterized protein n=1 Tax=Didymosphaeria variabile TaxID=1932322 RepID=A0A9W8XWY5_9PLEO|nr:uncharacterized protein N0V89_000194 [Didymosphaeria variabile]KAJ4359639.1 hypothetical protein N0V89_000194 [Didymosphaeria variabile]